MRSLFLDPDKKHKEWKTIQSVAKNNTTLILKLNHQIQSKANHIHNEKKHKIWTTFTYHSPKIRRIKNLFKNTNIRIANLMFVCPCNIYEIEERYPLDATIYLLL